MVAGAGCGYTPPPVPGLAVGRAGAGHGRLPLRRPAVPRGRGRRAAQPPAGDDAADRHGHHRRLRRQLATTVARRRSTWTSGGSWPCWSSIMLLGHWLEMRALGQAPGRAGRPGRAAARRGRAGHRRRAPRRSPVGDSGRGDVVLVRPGGRVPADGVVVDGAGRARRVDDHRRVPAGGQAAPGDRVVAGTVATDSALRVRVDGRRRGHRPGRHPAAGRPRPRRPARGPRPWPTGRPRCCSTSPPAPASSPSWSGRCWASPTQAVERTVTVLVIACPHALGLAIPLVIAISTGAGGPSRHPGQGPAGAGADADRRRRAVRQDRHPDQGRATASAASPRVDGDERRAAARWPPRSRPTASTRWPGPSWPRPGPHRRRPAARRATSGRMTGRGVAGRRRRARRSPSAGPALLRELALAEPDGAGRPGRRLAEPRRRRALRRSRRQGRRGAGPGGRGPARVPPGRRRSCTGWASGW